MLELFSVQSFFYKIEFSKESIESQRWGFTEELLCLLEESGLVAGGVQNPQSLDLAVDNLAETDLSHKIDEIIQSQCSKHDCVVSCRKKDVNEPI